MKENWANKAVEATGYRRLTASVGARRMMMNEEQIVQLLKAVAVGKNCLLIIAAGTILITAYAGFAFWKYHLSDPCSSDAGLRKAVWRAQQMGDYQKAALLCRRKLETEPGNIWLFQLGSAQFNLGQWQESIDTMTKVLSIAPHMKEQAEPFIEKAKGKLGERQTPQPPSEGDLAARTKQEKCRWASGPGSSLSHMCRHTFVLPLSA